MEEDDWLMTLYKETAKQRGRMIFNNNDNNNNYNDDDDKKHKILSKSNRHFFKLPAKCVFPACWL